MPTFFASSFVDAGLRDGVMTLVAGPMRREVPWPNDPLALPDAAERAALVAALKELAPTSPWRPKTLLRCSLPAHGVTVRSLRVPATSGAEFQRLLQLQVETSFPVPPEDLAWGVVEPASPGGASDTRSGGELRTVHVAAIRRGMVQPIASAVSEAGLIPTFTLSARVRHGADLVGFTGCRLDVGRRGTDMGRWEDGQLVRVRTLPAGIDNPAAAAEALAAAVKDLPAGMRISLAAELDPAGLETLAGRIPGRGRVEFRTMSPGSVDGAVPLAAWTGERLPLRIAVDSDAGPTSAETKHRIPAEARPWLVRAAVLAGAILLFPWVEALIQRPRLQRQLTGLGKDLGRLPEIDRRLDFLQHIADSQPPYFDATYVISKSAPQGTKLDGFTMNRRGEVSLNGHVQQPPQVGEFRDRLMESRFFSSVVVEEQSMPQPGGGRANFRISAQWKPAPDREALQLGPEPPPPPTGTNAPSGTNGPAKPSATAPQNPSRS
jgi:hypothetical protein